MRKRFFLIARCDGRPIIWPKPIHAPADSEEVKAGLLKPYVGAYTQLDFSLPCPSIFDTSEEIKEKYGIRAVRPLAPKTMERIARGLKNSFWKIQSRSLSSVTTAVSAGRMTSGSRCQRLQDNTDMELLSRTWYRSDRPGLHKIEARMCRNR